jgi:hypothetical protein
MVMGLKIHKRSPSGLEYYEPDATKYSAAHWFDDFSTSRSNRFYRPIRRMTTRWAAFELLSYFGATPVEERVVVDGNLVSAAGVTAGIDGALRMAELLCGTQKAQEIQLDIQYAPDPPFNSGSVATAPPEVVSAVRAAYQPLTAARLVTAPPYQRKAWDRECCAEK